MARKSKKNKTTLARCQVTLDPWEKNALDWNSSAHTTTLLSDPLWTTIALLHKIISLLRRGYNEVSSARCLPSPSLLLPPGLAGIELSCQPSSLAKHWRSLEYYKGTLGKAWNVAISTSQPDSYLKKRLSAFCILCIIILYKVSSSLPKSGSFSSLSNRKYPS